MNGTARTSILMAEKIYFINHNLNGESVGSLSTQNNNIYWNSSDNKTKLILLYENNESTNCCCNSKAILIFDTTKYEMVLERFFVPIHITPNKTLLEHDITSGKEIEIVNFLISDCIGILNKINILFLYENDRIDINLDGTYLEINVFFTKSNQHIANNYKNICKEPVSVCDILCNTKCVGNANEICKITAKMIIDNKDKNKYKNCKIYICDISIQ